MAENNLGAEGFNEEEQDYHERFTTFVVAVHVKDLFVGAPVQSDGAG